MGVYDLTNNQKNSVELPTDYQSFIHVSRYARWIDEENRRESWNETVTPAEGTVVWSDEPDEGVGFLIKTKWGLWDFDCLDIQVSGNIFEGVEK